MIDSPPVRRPAKRHRRRPSRAVRLRRTITVAVALMLFAVMGTHFLGRDDAVPVVDVIPTARATPSPHARGGAAAESVDSEDGASATDTRASGAAAVLQRGTGKLTVLTVPPAKDRATGRPVTYTVEIEGGLPVDGDEVATTVQAVLLDPQGWQAVDDVRFVNVSPAQAAAGAHVDIRVTLASPGLTDELCAPLQTRSQVSCWNGERSVLNYRRWALGDDSYGTEVARYRIYQVNHEVGHGLGHQHRQCPGKDQRAPVMVQQTLDLGGCQPWPYPSGA